jgi:PAS domain-containing protein
MAVLVATQLAAIVLVLLDYILHDFLIKLRTATISPVLLVVWFAGMVIAMKRYQFLSITPETVSKAILNAIDEIIILINEDEEITYMNNRALALFGLPYRKLDHSGVNNFISGTNKEKALIPDITTGTRKRERAHDTTENQSSRLHETCRLH